MASKISYLSYLSYMKKQPPLIQQFIENQKKFPDAVVATEVGGFFEIWEVHEEDRRYGHAIRVSSLLDVVLTKRNKADPYSPHMVGFPSHSAHNYFKRLVELGETVVIVEQNIRGKKTDGNKNVIRQISKILSPGLTLDSLNESKHNYFASFFFDEDVVGISLADVSTGEVKSTEIEKSKISDFLSRFNPKEIISNIPYDFKTLNHLIENPIKKLSDAGKIIERTYELKNPTSNPTFSISSLGLEKWKYGSLSLANLLNYLTLTEYNKKLLEKIGKPYVLNLSNNLNIPKNAIDSLELISSKRDDFTLVYQMSRKIHTAMGKRLISEWILNPSTSEKEINHRLDTVEKYIKNKTNYLELKDIYDIARISRKMVLSTLNPHEISYLYQSLITVDKIFKDEKVKNFLIKEIIKDIALEIDLSIAKEHTGSNWDFLKGPSLEKILKYKVEFSNLENELNTRFNEVKALVGSDKIKIVEKTEGHHLITTKTIGEGLKKKFSVKMKASEYEIIDTSFSQISENLIKAKRQYFYMAEKAWEEFQLKFIKKWATDLLHISETIAKIDVLNNFALLASERGYVRPKFSKKKVVHFKNLRHPIVELSRDLEEGFKPNSVDMRENSTFVIYGANASGKSTILKSLALNVIMAQMGSFVAAEEAEFTIFQNIFSRMSTNDSLSEGLSTFTLEMKELSEALLYSKEKSLFLFDEIGRGTDSNDGEALAYATIEYVSREENNCFTLFATHYHNLYEKIKDFKLKVFNLKCYNNEKGELVFLRKLEEGPGTGSYGIVMAKASGLPKDLIRSAENYGKKYFSIKKSKYNSNVSGTICPICNENPVMETHHMIEQKQGKVKSFKVDGVVKNINTKDNLIMICENCHGKITRKEIDIDLVKTTEKTLDINVLKLK